MSSRLVDSIKDNVIKIKWKGEYVWVAMEIAEHLDYDKPSKVVNYFLSISELVEEKDYLVLSQNDLREFKDILASMRITKFRQSPKLILFYVSGLVEFLKYRNKLTIEEIEELIYADFNDQAEDITSSVLIKTFKGYDIYTLMWNGKLCWIAVEIAKTLGYSRTSIAVNQCIKSEGFKKGVDYEILIGEEAREVIKPICDTHIGSGKNISTITIFYKKGLLGFINYSQMPIGKVFREWLRDEVFEELIDMEVGDIISESKFSVKRDNLSNNDLDNFKVHNSKFEIMDILNVVDKILDEKDEMKLFCLNTIFKNI